MFSHVDPELDVTKDQELIQQFELLREDAVGLNRCWEGGQRVLKPPLPTTPWDLMNLWVSGLGLFP